MRIGRNQARGRDTLRARRRTAGDAGFTLFEVLLALMLMALLAGLALPTPHRPAGPMTLRMTAYGVLALLREARSGSANAGRPAEAVVDSRANALESGGRSLVVPDGVTIALADRTASAITFAPDGTSSGGTVVLRTAADRVSVAVEGGTGAIHLVP